MLEQEGQDQAYGAFVRELHRRIAAGGCARPRSRPARRRCCIGRGLRVRVVSFGLAALTLQALQIGAWAGAAFVGGFLACSWQSGNYSGATGRAAIAPSRRNWSPYVRLVGARRGATNGATTSR